MIPFLRGSLPYLINLPVYLFYLFIYFCVYLVYDYIMLVIIVTLFMLDMWPSRRNTELRPVRRPLAMGLFGPVYFSRMYSPIGRSAQFCSVLFEVNLRDIGCVTRRLAWQLYNRDMYCHKDDIHVICELLAVKHGDLELDLFNNSVLDVFIEFLCTD